MDKKTTLILALSVAAFVSCVSFYAAEEDKKEELLRALSDRTLRLHIVADSDGKIAQELKLKVRDRVLEYLEEELPPGLDADATKKWARGRTKEIEAVSREALKKEGAVLPVRAFTDRRYFSDSSYGGMLFPAGNYDTLRIEIGKARGQNWWCVLYPWLCPGKTGRLVVPGEQGMTKGFVAGIDEADFFPFKNIRIKWYYMRRKNEIDFLKEKYDGTEAGAKTDIERR